MLNENLFTKLYIIDKRLERKLKRYDAEKEEKEENHFLFYFEDVATLCCIFHSHKINAAYNIYTLIAERNVRIFRMFGLR